MLSLIRFVALFTLAATCLPPALRAAHDWPRFRGPSGGGHSEGSLPSELNLEKNLLWKAACGKGMSSPVVVGNRLFLTAFEGDDRFVKCFDAASAEILWASSIRKVRDEVATKPGGPASSTPVADESNVYAFFPDAGLICYDHAGTQQWRAPLGPFHSFHGVSASLVLADTRVLLLADQLQDSTLTAFDCRTGAEAWKVVRQDGPIGGYSTPATRTTAQGKLELVVTGPQEVVGYDAATGRRNWTVTGVTNAPISVPVVSGNRIFLCEPSFSQNPFTIATLLGFDKNKDGELSFEEVENNVQVSRIAKLIDASFGNGDRKITGEEMDKAFQSFVDGGGLASLEIDETSAAPAARVAWTYRKSVPQIPSLLLTKDALFFINDGGILTSMNPENGEILKRARLGHGAKYYASPVAASGRMLLLDTEGKAAIVTTEAEWKTLSTTDLADRCYATPSLANNRVYIRGEDNLYCFRSTNEPS
jgi:outer membrane protein assembly factor BamB